MWPWTKRLVDEIGNLPLPALIKRTRVLVVDDDENSFPFEIIRDAGYNVEHWPDIKDLDKLVRGHFDIIFLDICGIGRRFDEEQEGVGILKHIKQANPLQIVIAYSGEAHSSDRIQFFRLADQYVPKTATSLEIKAILDDIVEKRLGILGLWSDVASLLSKHGCSPRRLRKIEKALVGSIKNGNRSDLRDLLGDAAKVAGVLGLVSKIVDLGKELLT